MARKLSQGVNPYRVLRSASTMNPAIEAGQFYQHTMVTSKVSREGRIVQTYSKVKARNNTGQNIAKGGVVKLGASLLTTLETLTPWFAGETPSDRIAPYGVLLEAITNGAIGMALVSGLCVASVDVQHAQHRWADMGTTTTSLKSYATGSARIVTPITGTGVQDCIVNIGDKFRGVMLGKADGSISAGATGTVSIYDGARADTTYNVTAYAIVALTSGKWLDVTERDGVYYATKIEC